MNRKPNVFIKEQQDNPTAAVVVVRFDDLWKIGHTMFERDGKLHIFTNPETAGLESILLRNILSIKGYSVVEERDFIWEDGTTDIEFITDMPYENSDSISQKV